MTIPTTGMRTSTIPEEPRSAAQDFRFWYGFEPKTLTPFGQWAVTEDGLFCLTTPYDIEVYLLQLPYWLSHMADKKWVNQADFKEAYDYALSVLFPKVEA